LSGTLGPNKIVLGMSSLMMGVLSIALINQKGITINKVILYINLVLSFLVLAISGSRTAYVGAAIFLIYFSLRQPLSIIYSVVGMGFFVALMSYTNPLLLQKTVEVYQNRVENKISNEEDLKEANVNKLYEDLGAGRDRILVQYINLLAEDYYFIPFGKGFNNRIETSS